VPKTSFIRAKLPDETCSITDRKIVGDKKEGPDDAVFRDYQVKISVKEYRVDGKFQLNAFTDDANVFLKTTGT
jgi:hypothetical protein